MEKIKVFKVLNRRGELLKTHYQGTPQEAAFHGYLLYDENLIQVYEPETENMFYYAHSTMMNGIQSMHECSKHDFFLAVEIIDNVLYLAETMSVDEQKDMLKYLKDILRKEYTNEGVN